MRITTLHTSVIFSIRHLFYFLCWDMVLVCWRDHRLNTSATGKTAEADVRLRERLQALWHWSVATET